MTSIDDAIKILNLSADFRNLSKEEQEKELANAWRKFSLKWHPDRNQSPEAEVIFKMGNNANDNIKEYIEKGYFASENTANTEYNTNYEETTEDTNEDVDDENEDETYHNTNTGYNSDRSDYYWDKYYNSDDEKELFLESSTPLKIILTIFIIAITIFFIKDFKWNDTTPKTQQQHIEDAKTTNNTPDTNSQKNSTHPSTSSNESQEVDLEPYVNEVISRIKMNWDKPDVSGNYKTVLLFKIAKDGRLLSCSVYKSSGLKSFDNAAVNAVYLAAPFRQLPRKYKDSNIDIQMVFEAGNNSDNYINNSQESNYNKSKSKSTTYKVPVPANGEWTPNPSLRPVGAQ